MYIIYFSFYSILKILFFSKNSKSMLESWKTITRYCNHWPDGIIEVNDHYVQRCRLRIQKGGMQQWIKVIFQTMNKQSL